MCRKKNDNVSLKGRKDYLTPPCHRLFLAKKLFSRSGELLDGAIAYIAPGGGGPEVPHLHPHDHLFIVTKGVAEIRIGEEKFLLHEGESMRVCGALLHSVWNPSSEETQMIGLTLEPRTTDSLPVEQRDSE